MSGSESSFYHITLVLVLTIAIAVAATAFAVLRADKLEQDWQHFSQSVVAKQNLLSELRSDIGYNGMIHHFKNYVIRKDTGHFDLTLKSVSKTLATIAHYQELQKPTEKEVTALKTITRVVEEYQRNLFAAKTLVAENKTTEQIDSVVKVDDTKAVAALRSLAWQLSENTDRYAESVSIDAGQIALIIMLLPIVILVCMFFVIFTIIKV